MISVKLINSLFIAFYIYCFGFCLCPPALKKLLLFKPLSYAVACAGYLSHFNVFVPPPHANTIIDVVIAYNNGTKSMWHYPGDESLGRTAKSLIAYRFISLKDHYLTRRGGGKITMLYQDMARFIARQNNTPARHPVQLQFIECRTPILLPSEKPLGQSALARQVLPVRQVLYVYQVEPEDLG